MDEIYAAAVAVMAEDGVAALNLTRVAHRIGLRQPSIYQYVASRMDLYDSLFKLAATEHLRVAREAISASPPGWPAARALCERTLQFAATQPVLAQLLFSGSIPGFQPSDDAYAPSIETMHALHQQMRIAVNQHELRADAATDAGIALLLSLVAGLASQRTANDPDSPPGRDRFSPLLPIALAMYAAYFAPTTHQPPSLANHGSPSA